MWKPIAVAAAVCGIALAQKPSAPEADALIEATRQVALEYAQSLPNFVCTEVVHRYYDNRARGAFVPLDTLAVKVTYFEQKEDHKLLLLNNKPTTTSFDDIAGATTVGEFGATIGHIFAPKSQAEFQWERWTRVRGRRAAVYSYRVRPENSNFYLNFRGDVSEKLEQAKVGFHGTVEVDVETHQVLHFTYEADNIPKEFPLQNSSTSVEYQNADVGGKVYMLPFLAENEMRSKRLWTRNKAEFREYRKYASESTITFGDGK